MPLTISIVSPFLKFIFNFERQLETPLAGFPFPYSLSIPDLTPLNEALSRMPRKTLWKSNKPKYLIKPVCQLRTLSAGSSLCRNTQRPPFNFAESSLNPNSEVWILVLVLVLVVVLVLENLDRSQSVASQISCSRSLNWTWSFRAPFGQRGHLSADS